MKNNGKATLVVLAVVAVVSVLLLDIITEHVISISNSKGVNTRTEFTLLPYATVKKQISEILFVSDFPNRDNCEEGKSCDEKSCTEGQECYTGECVYRERLIPSSENPFHYVVCHVDSDCPFGCQHCVNHSCTPIRCCTEDETPCGQSKCCSKEELCCNNECLKPCRFKGTTGRRSEQCDCLCETHKGFKLISKDGVCICRDGLIKASDGESCVQCNTDSDCTKKGKCMVCNESHMCILKEDCIAD